MCDLLPPIYCLVAASFAPLLGGKLWLVMAGFFIWSRNGRCRFFTTDDTIQKNVAQTQVTASSVRGSLAAGNAFFAGHAVVTGAICS
jgi:hypothetical protein